MKINGKTQPQRLGELMEEIVQNDGQITNGKDLASAHHLDPRILGFLNEKGMITRLSKRGAIHWNTKQPDHDMAVLVAREFNKWVNAKTKSRPNTYSLNILNEPIQKSQRTEKVFVGYRLNIFGGKIRLNKPTIRSEKEYAPF